MLKVDVFQSELNAKIPMDYIGRSIYVGESFGAVSFTHGNIYTIVRDAYNCLKVVDDSQEDYIWDLRYPKPIGSDGFYGELYYVDDPYGILSKYQRKAELLD